MKNKDLLTLYNYTCASSSGDSKFKFFISKTKALLNNEIKLLQSVLPKYKELEAYEVERIELCNKYWERLDNWDLVNDNWKYKIKEDKRIEFEEQMEKLRNRYKSVLSKANKLIEEYNDNLMEDSTNIQFPKIELKSIPDDIEQWLMDILVVNNLIK